MSNAPRYLTAAALTLLAASGAQAAFTTPDCLAQKLNAAGKFQKCRAAEKAKLLLSKPADLAKCSTKFQEKLAKLSDKASDAGIGCRYGDNGDGTVTDYDTGLQWEKKVSPGGGATDPHDVDNRYDWTIAAFEATPDGEAFTDFLGKLNNCTGGTGFNIAGFAFHCDWRLPTLAELQAIFQGAFPCTTSPCIDPIFGPTGAGAYWSATTFNGNSDNAWVADFSNANYNIERKIFAFRVRAVRGGL